MKNIYTLILLIFSFYFSKAQNPVAALVASDTATCEDESITFFNHSTGATSCKWLFPGAEAVSDSTSDSTMVWYIKAGYYSVTLIAYNGGSSDTLTLVNYIHVYPNPPTPTITEVADTLFCSTDPSYISYQWYEDTALLAGETNSYLVITQNSNYNVLVKNQYGCAIAVGLNIFEPPPVSNFTASRTTICVGDCISFTNQSSGAEWFQWYFPGATPSGSSYAFPPEICYNTPGQYDVTLDVGNPESYGGKTRSKYITVNPLPPAPVITLVHDTLYCSYDSSYAMYQWYADTSSIVIGTSPALKIYSNGYYRLKVTSHAGCTADTSITIVLGLHNEMNSPFISLSPNPVRNLFAVYGLPFTVTRLDIYNVFGQLCLQLSIINYQSSIELDVSSLPPGIYFVQLTGEKRKWEGRFVKE